ncbi:MAG: hypothetical protein IH983_00175 [Planctomycetes bacterium]|nr:hypothetical protein [Planctomycetota bacterium]
MTVISTSVPTKEPGRNPNIEVTADEVRLVDYRIASRDVAAYLLALKDDDRSQAFVHAVEVGVYCIQRATATVDIEFVKRRVNEIVTDVGAKIDLIPVKLEKELVEKLGSEDGQVLKPIVDLIHQVIRTTKDQLTEVKDEIDPSKDTSAVGKAIKGIHDLIDPNRKDSVQGALEAAITKVTGEDGALAKAVKAVVNVEMDPVKKRLEKLSDQILGQEAAEEAVMQTIEKGRPFEDQVLDELRPWANAIGAELRHVGVDNRPGDILIKLTDTSLAGSDLGLVIEVRDRQRPVGLKTVAEDLSKKMVERDANAAIYLSKSAVGLGNEVGEWAEGDTERGPWVATTHEHLRTALRFLLALHKLRSIRTAQPEVDVSIVENQIRSIRTSLKKISTINRKVTDQRKNAEEIGNVADTLRYEILEALCALEAAIGIVGGDDEEKAPASDR